jgi:hypothetical protein
MISQNMLNVEKFIVSGKDRWTLNHDSMFSEGGTLPSPGEISHLGIAKTSLLTGSFRGG